MTILRTSFPICWKTCFSTIYNSCFSCLWSAPSLNIHAHVCDSKMVLGLDMSQAGRDKTTSWKFYFIYRKCRLILFLKSMTSREAGQGGEGRTVRDTRSLRYTVTLLHCCHAALTPLLHWHTDTIHGPGLWTTAAAD